MSIEYMKKIHAHAWATSCYNKKLTLPRIIVVDELVRICVGIIAIIASCERAGGRTCTT